MKICLLAEFNESLDEGMRKISAHIFKELSRNHQVLALDLRRTSNLTFWTSLRRFDPRIIHYINGSSVKSFILLKSVSYHQRHAKTIISMILPKISCSKGFISLLRPDLVLVSSREMKDLFRILNFRTEFLPLGGVNPEKFSPASKKQKERLREKYGVDISKFMILHVGHVRKGRNVQLLGILQEKCDDTQVILVASTYNGTDEIVLNELEKVGCIIWNRYFEHIEEIYALADCYLFPTKSGGNAIQTPLSVLEAMACNLPVITTRFGALPWIFNEGSGLFFADKQDDFIKALELVRDGKIEISTRKKVLPYSWREIAEKLEDVYLKLLEGEEEE